MSIVEKAADKLRRKGRDLPPPKPNDPVVQRAAMALKADEQPQRPAADAQGIESPKGLSLDVVSLRNQGLFPTEVMEAQLLEEYRRIKRPLLSHLAKSSDRAANRIMVTSALAGEGKTYTSINLALSLAQEHDVSVLLVDADVVRPTISRALGLDGRRGLIELLNEPTLDPHSLVVPTDWGRLSVLPSGQPRSLMTELLSSGRVEAVFAALERYSGRRPKLLILDSPPLLATTESLAIAHAVGSILMVVKAGQTYRQQVLSALELLDPEKHVSFVLNQLQRAHGTDYYGGYYGYYGRH